MDAPRSGKQGHRAHILLVRHEEETIVNTPQGQHHTWTADSKHLHCHNSLGLITTTFITVIIRLTGWNRDTVKNDSGNSRSSTCTIVGIMVGDCLCVAASVVLVALLLVLVQKREENQYILRSPLMLLQLPVCQYDRESSSGSTQNPRRPYELKRSCGVCWIQ